MGVTVAEGVVIVSTDAANVVKDVERVLMGGAPAFTRQGRNLGESFEQAFDTSTNKLGKGSLESLKSEVESTARKVQAARDKEADAAGKVRVAERELAEARERYSSDSAKVVRAEETLESANRQLRKSQRDTLDATEANTRSLGRLGDASKEAADDLERDGRRAGEGWIDTFKGSLLGNIAADAIGSFVGALKDGIVNGIQAAWDFTWDSINIASGLNEASTAIDQVFGSGAGIVNDFAANASKAIGQSRLDALKAAQTFGIYGRSAGLANDENAKFSNDLVRLASDFASFYDTSPEQAIEAIGAALRGESEPIRTYGILLDDATLKARAMTSGLIQTSVDMTKVEGAQLKVEAAQKKVNDATGKYGPESLEARQAMQDLKEAQEQLSREVEGTNTGPLTQQQRVLAATQEIFAQASAAAGDFERTSGGLANQQRTLAAQFEDAKGKLGESLLPVMLQLVQYANDEFMPAFTDIIDKVGPELGDALIESLPSLMELLDTFVELLPEITELATNSLPLMIEAGNLLLPVVKFLVENMGYWYGAINDVIDLLQGDVSIAEWRGKLEEAGGVLGWLKDVIDGMHGTLTDFISWVGNTTGSVQGFKNGMGDVGRSALDMAASIGIGVARAGQWVADLPNRMREPLMNAGVWLYNSGRAVIEGFISGIRSMIDTVRNVAGGVVQIVRDFFPNSPAKTGPFSGSGWTRLRESGGAVIDQWAAGMRDSAPDVPFDLMGLTSPSRGPARASVAMDAASPGISARAASTTSTAPTQVNVDVTVKADDPTLAGRQVARGITERLGI